MVTYFLNLMGPVNSDWIEENGDCWAIGRIDVQDDSMFGDEYGVWAMHKEDWKAFGRWLNALETDDKWTYEQLIEEFEKQEEVSIRWLNPDKKGHNV